MKTLFIRSSSALFALGIILAGCDAPTGAASGGSATVKSLVYADFKAKGWDLAWKDRQTAHHKCQEKDWFYAGIGAQTSVAGLDAFWDGNNPEGLDMNQSGSRTYKVARLVLEGGSVPEDLKHKARCLIDY